MPDSSVGDKPRQSHWVNSFANRMNRIWKLVLAVGFPLLGLLSSFEKDNRMTLVGIGIMTILVPAIVPDLEPPESHSLMKQIYFRTAGKWIANFFESYV